MQKVRLYKIRQDKIQAEILLDNKIQRELTNQLKVLRDLRSQEDQAFQLIQPLIQLHQELLSIKKKFLHRVSHKWREGLVNQ